MEKLYAQYTDNDTWYSYQGEISQTRLEEILSEVVERMRKEEIIPKVISCAYSVLVEGVQNMVRYCYVREGEPMQGMVVVKKQAIGFHIVLANYIDRQQEAKMIYQLERLNFMTKDELKEKLSQNRRTNALRANCSAGLGLMEISCRSSGKLNYQMVKRSLDYSIFLLEVVI